MVSRQCALVSRRQNLSVVPIMCADSGSSVSFVTAFICLMVGEMTTMRAFFHATLWSGCAMAILVYFAGEYLSQQE
jgi:hypothetical protein